MTSFMEFMFSKMPLTTISQTKKPHIFGDGSKPDICAFAGYLHLAKSVFNVSDWK